MPDGGPVCNAYRMLYVTCGVAFPVNLITGQLSPFTAVCVTDQNLRFILVLSLNSIQTPALTFSLLLSATLQFEVNECVSAVTRIFMIIVIC